MEYQRTFSTARRRY